MLPSELRLLQGIQDALHNLAAGVPDAAKPAFAAIGVALNELLLRNDRGLFVEHYAQGHALLREGTALAHAPASAVDAVPAALDSALHFDVLGAQLDALCAALAGLVFAIAAREREVPQAAEWLTRVVDWENALNARRVAPPPPPPAASASRFTQQAIEHYLQQKHPQRGAPRVSGLKLLAGGFSKLTVLFDVEYAAAPRESLVIRAEQASDLLFLEGARVANEFRVLQLAHAAGIAVAEPLWLEEDTSLFGACFLVTRRAAGRNIGTAISVDEKIPPALLEDMVRQLVRIHRTAIDPADACVRQSHLARWREFPTLGECTAAQVAFWRRNIERLGLPPSATLARILEWLSANVPASREPPGFVHVDYGLHNILVGNDDRVSCILDWEGACLGDPAEDFVWFADGLRGHAERAQLLEMYRKAGGPELPEERLRFFDVFRSLKYAVVCPRALQLFEQHRGASVAACQLGLVFPYFGSLELNRHLAAARAEATSS
jgi:aminoglycoside phosphotransferase (APT) family kinase protein